MTSHGGVTARACGVQGFWGLLISTAALPVLSMVNDGDGLPLDSLSKAMSEISGSWQLQLSTAAAIVSIAFFNFFGVRPVTAALNSSSSSTSWVMLRAKP